MQASFNPNSNSSQLPDQSANPSIFGFDYQANISYTILEKEFLSLCKQEGKNAATQIFKNALDFINHRIQNNPTKIPTVDTPLYGKFSIEVSPNTIDQINNLAKSAIQAPSPTDQNKQTQTEELAKHCLQKKIIKIIANHAIDHLQQLYTNHLIMEKKPLISCKIKLHASLSATNTSSEPLPDTIGFDVWVKDPDLLKKRDEKPIEKQAEEKIEQEKTAEHAEQKKADLTQTLLKASAFAVAALAASFAYMKF